MRPWSHHIHCQGGLYGGSSGAPFILRNGRVTAIHVESSKAAESIDTNALSTMPILDAIELVSETVYSNTMVHGSISTDLYLAKCPTLLRALANIGADFASSLFAGGIVKLPCHSSNMTSRNHFSYLIIS